MSKQLEQLKHMKKLIGGRICAITENERPVLNIKTPNMHTMDITYNDVTRLFRVDHEKTHLITGDAGDVIYYMKKEDLLMDLTFCVKVYASELLISAVGFINTDIRRVVATENENEQFVYCILESDDYHSMISSVSMMTKKHVADVEKEIIYQEFDAEDYRHEYVCDLRKAPIHVNYCK